MTVHQDSTAGDRGIAAPVVEPGGPGHDRLEEKNVSDSAAIDEFFDAERHSQLTFSSQEITRSGGELTVQGELTIKGETRPIELTGTIADPITDPWGNERFGIKLEGDIDRTAFGVDWNNPLPTGEPALANEVKLVAELQLVKAA